MMTQVLIRLLKLTPQELSRIASKGSASSGTRDHHGLQTVQGGPQPPPQAQQLLGGLVSALGAGLNFSTSSSGRSTGGMSSSGR